MCNGNEIAFTVNSYLFAINNNYVKIIATGITNLTDARYFSAMRVDWLGFDMSVSSSLTLEHVIAFADWIEGPELFVDVRGRTVEEIAVLLSVFSPAALLTDSNETLSHFAGKHICKGQFDDNADILLFSSEELMKSDISVNSSADLWVEISNMNEFKAISEKVDLVSGVVIAGGDEDKVGVKNYDEIDTLIEFFQED